MGLVGWLTSEKSGRLYISEESKEPGRSMWARSLRVGILDASAPLTRTAESSSWASDSTVYAWMIGEGSRDFWLLREE